MSAWSISATPHPDRQAGGVRSIEFRRGRFLFGIGIGWNAEEMEDHGTVFATRAKLVRRAHRGDEGDLDQAEGGIPRNLVHVPEMMAWPKPVQKPIPRSSWAALSQAARRAVRYGDGWIPLAGQPDQYGDVFEFVPRFRAMLQEAGRDAASCPVTLVNVREDADLIKRYRDLGVVRVSFGLPAEGRNGPADPRPLDAADPAGERLIGSLHRRRRIGWLGVTSRTRIGNRHCRRATYLERP